MARELLYLRKSNLLVNLKKNKFYEGVVTNKNTGEKHIYKKGKVIKVIK